MAKIIEAKIKILIHRIILKVIPFTGLAYIFSSLFQDSFLIDEKA